VADLAERERTEKDIERLRDTGDRLSGRAVSLDKQVAVLTERVEQMRAEVAQHFALMAVEGRLQQITDIISSLQDNAYGQTGSVLSTSNLLLAGNQLFWTLLDPVLRNSGVLTKSGSFTLSLLTPIGSLITGQLLVGNRQHERFITGVSTTDATGIARETLRSRIAESEWTDFQRRQDVIVIVERLPNFLTRATVNDGVLTIQVSAVGGLVARSRAGVRVGWILDTGIGNG
jgi:ribosomal protein S15P/S13E